MLEILILLLLTFINGFFALSEIALVSLKSSRIEQKAASGNRKAQIALNLLKDPENFLSSIQVGITLIGIVAGAYGGAALTDDVQPLIQRVPLLAPYAATISVVLIVGLITYFTIVIGELIPKTIALSNPERIALAVAPVIKYFSAVTYPLVRLLSGSTQLVIRLLRIKDSEGEKVTEEELRYLIKAAGTQGVLERHESLMHQNVFVFSELRAKTLKTPRSEVQWINIGRPVEDIADALRESYHSKFPAAEGSLDNIKGILTIRTFFENKDKPGFTVEQILQEPVFIPETLPAFEILRTFRRSRQYIGLVVDEYGNFEGIVTLHDLVEAILGELPDLDEEEEPAIVSREDLSFLVNGSTSVIQLNEKLGKLIRENAEHYTTLGGFILFYLKRIPHTGDKFEFNGYEFEIVDLDGPRIDKVLIRKKPPQGD